MTRLRSNSSGLGCYNKLPRSKLLGSIPIVIKKLKDVQNA